MKVLLVCCTALVLNACTQDKSSTVNTTSKLQSVKPINTPLDSLDIAVADAIELALKKADFRLLHSQGRRIVVPGLESYELEILESQCGLKAITKSSDVLKTPEQRQQQKQQYAFAKRYNQAMYQQCIAARDD